MNVTEMDQQILAEGSGDAENQVSDARLMPNCSSPADGSKDLLPCELQRGFSECQRAGVPHRSHLFPARRNRL